MSFEIRSVIHFCYLRKLSCDDCLIQINEAYGIGTISFSTARRWHIAFASSKTILDANDRVRRWANASISMRVQEILMDKSFVSTRYITKKPEQPRAGVLNCLHEEFGLDRIKFHWVRYELSENKVDRVKIAKVF
jgi:hypothetical protein